MNKPLIPLSGRGEPIVYARENGGFNVRWGATTFHLSDELVETILTSFFVDAGHWYPLGSSADTPMAGGLGQFVKDHGHNMTPRHASAVAPILVSEGLLDWRGAKPIELRRQQ